MQKIVKKKRLLHILLGFLIASTAYLYMEYRYEQKILQAFIQSIKKTENLNQYDEQALVLASMHKIHTQMKLINATAMNLDLSTFENTFTSPLLKYALTKDGACGGNSLVLSQVLDGMGFKVKPSQMEVNGKFGGHIIVETQINGKWCVLDPLYNLAFKNVDGTLASFDEVKNNWAIYKSQVPSNYDFKYAYTDARYTNWSKLPIIGPATKIVLNAIIGKNTANKISLRALFLNPKKLCFYLFGFLLGFSVISILNKKYLRVSIPSIKFQMNYARKILNNSLH
jgi:hypothetical protein